MALISCMIVTALLCCCILAASLAQNLRSASRDALTQSQVVQALCDFIDGTGVDKVYSEWVCKNSLTSSDYCTWTGISCNNSEIVDLSLIDVGLVGTLPVTIGNLASLQSLSLSENSLSRTIPNSVCFLTQLGTLLLDNNALTGSIPNCIGSLVSLEELDLHSNLLDGSIPLLMELNQLIILDLDSNMLTGPLLYLGSSLVDLDLSQNLLSGIIPNASLPWVTSFSLHDNLLSGTIPYNFNDLVSVQYYDVQYNSLSGSIPKAVVNSTSLGVFVASSNQLTGSLHPELAQPYLSAVILNNNQLIGPIPGAFSSLTMLLDVYLQNNRLTGVIPSLPAATFIDVTENQLTGTLPCGFYSVVSLVVKANQLTGTVPECISDSHQYMQILDLSDNLINGTVPALNEVLPLLAYFDMSYTRVSGTIPSALADAQTLVFLGLAGNGMTGTIPHNMGSSGTLVYLLLQENRLGGTIPYYAQYLRCFNLTNNRLTGPVVPSYWHANATIGLLLVAHNQLTGSIPAVACSFRRLLTLSVSHNNLDSSACYPSCLKLLTQDFYSSIPRCYGDQDTAMCELAHAFDVAAKQSTVVVTTVESISSPSQSVPYYVSKVFSVPNAFEYQVSFLGYTVFALYDYVTLKWSGGSITLNDHNHTFPGYGEEPTKILADSFVFTAYVDFPARYGFSATITVLSRGSGWQCANQTREVNGVNETLLFAVDPCSWTGVSCYLDQVTGLSLRGLALVGPLPPSVGLLSSLASLDLSFNSINGRIPTSLGLLPALSTADLSSNSLTGTLPSSIATLQLSYLSVANNKLNGTVPSFLGSMNYLTVIRLDANQFTGKLTNDVCAVPLAGHSISVVNTDLACFESCWDQFVDQPSLFAHDAALDYCAPTSTPTSVPSSPSSRPTQAPKTDSGLSSGALIGIVVAGLVVLFGLALFGFYSLIRTRIYPSKESMELTNMLKLSPIHRAVLDQSPLTPEFVSEHLATSTKLTPDGRTALDLILDAGTKCDANAVVVFILLDNQLPKELKHVKTAGADCMNNNKAWCRMVQQHDDRSLTVVEKVLETYRPAISILAYGMDEYGRKYLHIASARCKEAINRVLYLHERYEFDGPPEHQTSTSILRFAFDHKRIVDSHGVKVAKKVALKFMASAGSFQREVYRRAIKNTDSSEYFLAVYESYDGDRRQDPEHWTFREDAISKGYEDYPYCIVMEAAESNLDRVLNSRRIAGSDWEEIRRIFKQVVASVEYLHRHQVIHGDIKPSNVVVLSNNAVRIIDFDNSVAFSAPPTGRSSTAYCPPEHFQLLTSNNNNNAVSTASEAVAVEVKSAHPSQDMWALGALLYLLCTGVSLFFCDIDDNIADSDDMVALCQWDDSVRDRKLHKISDKLARNLVSLMLNKNAERRVDALHALDHPFLTGKQVIRLSDDKSEFDVFISYRVASDAHHAKLLYNELTAKGLRVWLDSQCLKSGKNWEKGFCEGLFKSDYVVCMVSKEGMRSDTTESLNWTKLSKSSPCDNVMLEWMLAIELQHRSLIKGVFPVFIGSTTDDTTYDKFYLSGRDLPDVSVSSVEAKLKHHLDREGCGLPYNLKFSVRSVVDEVVSNQGAFLSGELDDAVKSIVEKIEEMVKRS